MKTTDLLIIIPALTALIFCLVKSYQLNRRARQHKQTRSILPEHTCKYCGCRTSQPDDDCYAHPSKDDERNLRIIEEVRRSTQYDEIQN
jgi:hypothetical protein